MSESVRIHTSHLKVTRPSSVSAAGLFHVLVSTLQNHCCKSGGVVGFGSDGAAAYVASAELKGLVEEKLPWVFWMYGLAHRLALAIKDALKRTSLDLIDEMLHRLYLLYENSPKKHRQLEEVVTLERVHFIG